MASKGVDFNRVEASNLKLLNLTERWRSPVDRTAFEMLRSGNTTVGSNPTLSATWWSMEPAQNRTACDIQDQLDVG